MDDSVPFASNTYWLMVAILALSRGADFLSTWVATPHLVLEGNPIAKWLGWKWGAVVNVILVAALSRWPLSAIVVSTASLLVAARNFQSAWVMRSMGEEAYRLWYAQRLTETSLRLYLVSLAGNALLTAAVGVALIVSSVDGERALIVPFGIGTGVVAYAIAVVVFTLLALWRGRRQR
ncbi:MAG: hypothetical protein EPO07_05380 [Verrucomicrobia bacterium]|nr:MAG: hypothetical protein EPO07_05380 [Verrucomicrobiota bacterium]